MKRPSAIYNNYLQNQMMNIFRSKQEKNVFKLLQSHGFNSKDFKKFKIGDLAKQVTSHNLLPALHQIIKDNKMTHLKLLKSSLLVLHILQISQKVQENPSIGQIIRQLQIRTKTVVRYSSKPPKISNLTNTRKDNTEDQVANHTAKQFYDFSCIQSPQSVELNSLSYLLGKLVQPLLHIQQKILYCHEFIYRPKVQMNSQTCWATINLLKKFSQLSQTIQEIGRYFKELIIPIVCTIRVLSLDIRVLYRRVSDFIRKQCAELKMTIESKSHKGISDHQQQKMKQAILLVQELQKINQSVRLLYCNKYFSDMLVLNNIFMPAIFSTGQENLQLLYSFLEYKTNKQLNFSLSRLIHRPKYINKGSLQKVQNV